MASKILHLAKVAWDMPLPLLLTRGLRKFGFESAWTRRVDFLHSEDTQRPTKAATIILDSMRKAGVPAQPLAAGIPGALLLEIGCGRHAGLAPFVLGLGARRYIGVDPSLDGMLLALPEVRERYLAPALDAARAFARSEPHFSDMPFGLSGLCGVEEALSRCRFEKAGIGQLLGAGEKADICVSISCLEHIGDFSEAAKAMAKLSHERTVHLHVVNFSNHLSKRQPFHQLYEMPYAEFGRRWNYNVNGLRVSDMQRELEKAGLPLRVIPLDVKPDALPERIDGTWLAQYGREELALRTALLTSL